MASEGEEEEEETHQSSIHQSRFEEMVTPFDTKTTLRLANFLNPLSKNIPKAKNFLPKTPLLSEIFSHDLHQWPSKVTFRGCYGLQKKWKQWVDKLFPKYSSVWKLAGIHQAIMASVYEIRQNPDTVLGLSEFWCSKTNTFLFPWGEATVTLEDIMILGGYPVFGDPVTGPVLTDEMGKLEEDFKNFRLSVLKKKGVQATHHGWLNYFMKVKQESKGNFVHIAFLSIWLSRFVFPTNADKHILNSLITIAVKLSLGVKLALGPAVLASLYRNLTIVREEALASKDKIIVSGPFMLLQIWVFERFPVLGPKPVDLKLPGLPRMARWDKVSLKVTLPLVRLAVKEANFCWRPYAAELKNWRCPSYFKEKEQSFSDCSNLDDEMRSFYGFLLVSEVVGIDCKEKYFPHRVAMQFGLDQDIPAHLSSVSLGSREPVQLFVPSRFSQPSVTLAYSNWWKGLLLARKGKMKDALLGKNGDTKNVHQISLSVQVSGNSQDYHVIEAAVNPFDFESESSMNSRSQNHHYKVSPEVPDKTHASNDDVIREGWNGADAGRRVTDFPTTPTILKGSRRSISPPPGFERLSSNNKKRLHELCDNEGQEQASLLCDKKAKVAKTANGLLDSIQAESSKAEISNANLVEMEYSSDDDDVVIISHLDKELSLQEEDHPLEKAVPSSTHFGSKCSSRKEKSFTGEVSETPKKLDQSSEVNSEEKVEPVTSGKNGDTKNGNQVLSPVQASGNSQVHHATDAAANPSDSESESSMDSSFQNHPRKVSPKVSCGDKTHADNDIGVREEWNEGGAGRTQTDFPTTPTIPKRSSGLISPPLGVETLSSNSKKRLVHEFSDHEGHKRNSLLSDKKAKVAKIANELPELIQAESPKAEISNVNLVVNMEYISDDDDDDDDVVIISHLEMGSNKCSSRKEKSSTLESLEVSETPKNFGQSSEVNAEEEVEPVTRAPKDFCEFASGFHREIKLEAENSANEPINVGFDAGIGKDSSQEHMGSVAKGGEGKVAGESLSNPITLDEDTVFVSDRRQVVEKRLQKAEKILGLV